ncbi:MAG: GHKL domain-containing protein [Propionibacteriaceae bacterium]|nr:GHKL domain-containing protein [Propionibacteriaceae bacterium]
MIEQSLPDIPRLLTGLAEWAAALVCVLPRQRLGRWRLLALAALAGGLQVGLQVWVGTWPLLLWPLGMALAVAGMFAFIAVALQARPPILVEAGCVAARALVLAELVAAAHWQVHCFLFGTVSQPDTAAKTVFAVVVYAAAFALAAGLERRLARTPCQPAVVRDLVSSIAIALATFALSNLSFLSTSTPFSGRLGPEIFYIRSLVDLCGLVALYAQQAQRLRHAATTELTAIQGLLRKQHEQYLQSKRSIDAIDRTYHDLKHQLGVIRAEADPSRRADHLDDLEDSIRDWEVWTRTGDEVLDVILTAKRRECAEAGVDLTAVADGQALAFMSVADLCTLFGNALDNAVQATSRLPDPEQRIIKLAVFRQGGLVVITVENSFSGSLKTEGGDIVTSQADPTGHGFGLKSIRHIAAKYGGAATVRPDGGWFVLRVLLTDPGSPAPAAGRDRSAAA